MPRQWLNEKLPTNAQLQQQLGVGEEPDALKSKSRILAWVNRKLADPLLWHLNRRSVAGAVAVGLFVGWLPIPMQMLIAAMLAALLRVHVPVSVVMVWFSNPITFPPLLYAAWYTGSTLLGKPILETPLDLSIAVLLNEALHSWPEILIGSVFCAGASAVAGFFVTNLVWRFVAVRRWKNRSQRA